MTFLEQKAARTSAVRVGVKPYISGVQSALRGTTCHERTVVWVQHTAAHSRNCLHACFESFWPQKAIHPAEAAVNVVVLSSRDFSRLPPWTPLRSAPVQALLSTEFCQNSQNYWGHREKVRGHRKKKGFCTAAGLKVQYVQGDVGGLHFSYVTLPVSTGNLDVLQRHVRSGFLRQTRRNQLNTKSWPRCNNTAVTGADGDDSMWVASCFLSLGSVRLNPQTTSFKLQAVSKTIRGNTPHRFVLLNPPPAASNSLHSLGKKRNNATYRSRR